MPFYPTDANLQAAAETAFAADSANYPSGYPTPYYSGGNGGGMGYALRLAAEYQLTPHVAVGGRFDLERSDYYSPNSALVYMRYQFNPVFNPTSAAEPDKTLFEVLITVLWSPLCRLF